GRTGMSVLREFERPADPPPTPSCHGDQNCRMESDRLAQQRKRSGFAPLAVRDRNPPLSPNEELRHRLEPVGEKHVNQFRIALANIRYPQSPDESISLAVQAIEQASLKGARIVCFPECFVPGYRVGKVVPPPNREFLERAWAVIAEAAGK